MTREGAITLIDELRVCIKEHPIIADWLVEIADRKTENCSEKPNNCELQTSGLVWTENAIKNQPKSYTTWASTDEPQTDGITFKGNLKEGNYKLIKTTDGWVLEGEDIMYCGWEIS